MIFIFGTRGTTGDPIPTDQNCPGCGEQHSIVMVPHQRYFHVFWIPIFPTSKIYTPVCTSCTGVFTTQKLPVTKEVRQQSKTPKWTFAGLFLIAGLVLFTAISGAIGSAANKNKMTDTIENPQAGDVYYVKTKPDNKYSVMKVTAFTNDSVYFHTSAARFPKKVNFKSLVSYDIYDTSVTQAYAKGDLESSKLEEIEVIEIARQ